MEKRSCEAENCPCELVLIICILCGLEIPKNQRPIPIAKIEFRPYIADQIPGEDNLVGMHSCQECYAKVLGNRAKAIGQYGQIKS